jgi:hypothetical protein
VIIGNEVLVQSEQNGRKDPYFRSYNKDSRLDGVNHRLAGTFVVFNWVVWGGLLGTHCPILGMIACESFVNRQAMEIDRRAMLKPLDQKIAGAVS